MRKYYSKKYNTKNNEIFDVSKILKNFDISKYSKYSENIKIPQKILSEIDKKWFLAFDVLKNDFLEENLKKELYEKIKNLSKRKKYFFISKFDNFNEIRFPLIFIFIWFILTIINIFLPFENQILANIIKIFFIIWSFYFFIFWSFYLAIIFLKNLKDKIENKEKIDRMVLFTENKIFIFDKILDFKNFNLENLDNFEKNSSENKNFRKTFFETEFLINDLDLVLKNLEKNFLNLEFWERNFSIFFKNIENSNILIQKIFKNIKKIKKIKNINLEKLEKYLKEKMIFSLESIKNILEKNLNYIENLIEKNKNSINNQIILINKRLELQKNSLQKNIFNINEKINLIKF